MEVVNAMEREVFAIRSAILLHGKGRSSGSGQGDVRFATIHPVESNGDTRPQILAGRVLSSSELEQALSGLNPKKRMSFIPEALLASSGAGMVWWRRPAKARVWFNTRQGDALDGKTGLTPQPGLVFAVAGGSWMVWAVKGCDRPTQDTELFQAPYFNVYETGSICVGNASIPKGVSPDTIPGYESAFFDSRFTHANVWTKNKLVKWRGGPTALWASLLGGRQRTFPERALVATGKTVGQVIEEIASGALRKGRG